MLTVMILMLSLGLSGALVSSDVVLSTAAKETSVQKPQKTAVKNAPQRKDILKGNQAIIEQPPGATKFNEPRDLLELVPFVRDINRLIPKRFSLINHQLLLDPNRIIIEHQFFDYPMRITEKNSIISFSYTGEFGNNMEANLDVPLFYSPLPGLYQSGWLRYPMGNYRMTFNKGTYSNDDKYYIKAKTKF